MDLGIVQLDGYTNYEIYDETLTWKSLLEFPLDTKLLSLEYTYESDMDIPYANTKIKMPFTINYQFNITSKNDKAFKDSDWVTSDFGAKPVIYAEAESKINARIIDINTLFYNNKLAENKNISLGVGYQNKSFDFVANNVWIDNDYYGYVMHIEEDVIEYEVKYSIPYLSANYNNEYKDIHYKLNLAYSPFVSAEDRDYHILRDKTTEGTTEGNMLSYSIGANTKINKDWSLSLNYEKTSIHTEGTQKQTFSDGSTIEDILTEVYMDSTAFTLSLTHSF
jgi:outer membrane protease